MPFSGYVLRWGGGCAALLLLSGCVASHKGGPQLVSPPDPFGYEKVSALCKLSPLTTDSSGRMSVEMTVGSDEGKCALSVSKGGGGSYISFGVDQAPEHGKTFLYNYDGRTYINYQPVTAYNGTDSFGVDLIPAHAQPRSHLTVQVKIEVVGKAGEAVKPAVPPVTEPAASTTKESSKKSVHSSRKVVRSKKAVAGKAGTAKSAVPASAAEPEKKAAAAKEK